MADGTFYTVKHALAVENDKSATDATAATRPSAKDLVEGMTIAEARKALSDADNNIKAAEQNRLDSIATKKFIKDTLFSGVM